MKKRLDVLVAKKQGISREKAQGLIMAGQVLVDKKVVDKVGIQINVDLPIFVKESFPYVSRGALKLEKAYQEFGLDFKEKIICDVGASTGGFTDFALQSGAAKVYAIDTGKGQIDQKLRQDSKVVLLENTNIKNVRGPQELSFRPSETSGEILPQKLLDLSTGARDDIKYLPEPIDFFVVDVSFISLKQVLPAIKIISSNFVIPSKVEESLGTKDKKRSLHSGRDDKRGQVIALIKPQFEVGKQIADKTKGVIKDPNIRQKVVTEIQDFAQSIGYKVKKTTVSPITGAKGNVEYLIYLLPNS